MKSLQTFLNIVLLNSIIFSQSGWELQLGGSSVYQPFYRDIMFVNGSTGWILCKDGIKHTINNGDNWIDYPINDTSITAGNSIFFIDPSNGWMTGNKLYKTTNSGQSWSPVSAVYNIKRIYFLNLLTGWSCGNNGILNITTNGGSSWDSISTGINENFNDVYFINAQTGIVAADWGKILRTTNGGVNWSVYYDNVTYSFMQRIKFTDSNTGFVCGSGGYIFKTTDAGANWTIQNTGSFNVLRDMALINSQTGYSCGMFGGIYRTTSGGLNWTQTASNGLYANTTGIEVTSSGRLWLLTDSSSVYKSDNNAESWTEIYRKFITDKYLYSIRFFNNTTGCACGDAGTMLRTTNGGQNWESINISTSETFRSMHFLNQQIGFAAGGNYRNIILKTTNAGISWYPVNSDSTPYLTSIFFLNQLTGWCAGFGTNNFLKTTDGGDNWLQKVPAGMAFSTQGIWFLNEYIGFALRYVGGGYYKTTDGGANWIYMSNIGNNCKDIFFTDNMNGYILSNSNTTTVVFKTTDGGNTWGANPVGPSGYYSIFFSNSQKGWIVGYSNNVFIRHTTNSGLNWSIQTTSSASTLNDVFFINNDEGWACGSSGTIVHTSTGGIGIQQLGSEIPERFDLYQNYPNPFNPVTKIRFTIPSSGNSHNRPVQLNIYDILGRKVETLINQYLSPGVYEVEFDGTKFASGVYFCSISSGDFVKSRKMILLK